MLQDKVAREDVERISSKVGGVGIIKMIDMIFTMFVEVMDMIQINIGSNGRRATKRRKKKEKGESFEFAHFVVAHRNIGLNFIFSKIHLLLGQMHGFLTMVLFAT